MFQLAIVLWNRQIPTYYTWLLLYKFGHVCTLKLGQISHLRHHVISTSIFWPTSKATQYLCRTVQVP